MIRIFGLTAYLFFVLLGKQALSAPRWTVVVDPASSGSAYVEKLQRRGYLVAMVKSRPYLDDDFESSLPPSESLDKTIIMESGKYQDVLAKIESLGPVAIFVGTETGIELYDRLASDLNLSGNKGPSVWRRDKVAMHMQLRESGLRSLKSFLVGTSDEARNLVVRKLLNFPVIAKPVDSAGQVGVKKVSSFSELEAHLHANIGAFDPMTSSHWNKFVIQEFAPGVEYVVNLAEGRVTDIWRYNKRILGDGVIQYDYDEILGAEDIRNDAPHLINYAMASVRALGIRGAAHAEIMYTETGPVLIEAAARPMGSRQHELTQKVIGYNQIDADIDSKLDRKIFTAKINSWETVANERKAFVVEAIAERDGVLSRSDRLEFVSRVEKLGTYTGDIKWHLAENGTYTRTTSLLESPAEVWLTGSFEELTRDYKVFRSIEKDYFGSGSICGDIFRNCCRGVKLLYGSR